MNALEKTALLLAALVATSSAGCGDHKHRVETETHFLNTCESSCEEGLSCICGVCTQACSDDGSCGSLPGDAVCTATSDACGGAVARTCDVTCAGDDDCSSLGATHTCRAGRCRAGTNGTSGAGGNSGNAGSGSGGGGDGGGGLGGAGSGGQRSGGAGGAGDAAIDGGGGAVDAGDDASAVGDGCDAVGEACCDPFPGDGPNYCIAGLVCGAGNMCEVNCDCLLGAYRPACGVDGMTYDATCGDACVPVAIACHNECPCDESGGYCTVGCSGVAPEQAVIDACEALTDTEVCQTFVTNGLPSTCRWVTPSTSMCPPFP